MLDERVSAVQSDTRATEILEFPVLKRQNTDPPDGRRSTRSANVSFKIATYFYPVGPGIFTQPKTVNVVVGVHQHHAIGIRRVNRETGDVGVLVDKWRCELSKGWCAGICIVYPVNLVVRRAEKNAVGRI